jgi:hypothetical protein
MKTDEDGYEDGYKDGYKDGCGASPQPLQGLHALLRYVMLTRHVFLML